jgi:replicative DNA helicase
LDAREQTISALRAMVDQPDMAPSGRVRDLDGEQFVFSAPSAVDSVWGSKDRVAWAKGEGLALVGPEGVGKTALAQQLALHRIGVRCTPLLGLPVPRSRGRVLYVAADRPNQAARSLRRMVNDNDAHREALRDRLLVWRGPLPFDLTESATALRDFVRARGCTDLFIDSLKDVAVDLSKDEVGSRVNRAFQEVIAADIELAVVHHQRKDGSNGAKPKTLTDVYGSRWITAGMGSVILLWGNPGDLVVELNHLKQPLEDLGPFNVLHDHTTGTSSLYQATTVESLLVTATSGLTVEQAARGIYATSGKPEPNQIEKARRRLENLCKEGLARRKDDPDGLARYFPLTP